MIAKILDCNFLKLRESNSGWDTVCTPSHQVSTLPHCINNAFYIAEAVPKRRAFQPYIQFSGRRCTPLLSRHCLISLSPVMSCPSVGVRGRVATITANKIVRIFGASPRLRDLRTFYTYCRLLLRLQLSESRVTRSGKSAAAYTA